MTIQDPSPEFEISIKMFRYIVPPPKVIVGVRENLMFLVNSHILKTATMLKTSAEYNRKAAIIESLRVGCSVTEIIQFFRYPRSTFYDVARYRL